MTTGNGDRVQRIRAALERWGDRVAPLVVNVTDEAEVRRILEREMDATIAELGLRDLDVPPRG